jgi:hypothetical protein
LLGSAAPLYAPRMLDSGGSSLFAGRQRYYIRRHITVSSCIEEIAAKGEDSFIPTQPSTFTYRVKTTGEVYLSLGKGHKMNALDMGNSVGMKWTLFLCFTPAKEI